jgi:predicted extracellular nuclease
MMPANAATPIVTIPEIQGKGHISPYENQEVTTSGIVTAKAFNGYYVQDPEGDSDDATSDGLFVFQGNFCNGCPSVGDKVELTDRVSEFIPGGAGTGNLSITQMSFPDTTIISSGNVLPSPVVIGRSGRIPPNEITISEDELPVNLQDVPGLFDPDQDGIDFYESLEGMLVKVEKPVAVSATRTFTPFSSEFFTLANHGRDIAPRDARTRRGGIILQPDPDNTGDQNPERVQIQLDGTLYPGDVPEVKVNDRLGDITGVVGYSFGNFEVNATQVFEVKPRNLRKETTRLTGKRKKLTIASYNILNLSAVARDDNQRATVASHIAVNMGAPDIIALQEVQDNNGDINDCEDEGIPIIECSNVLDADLTLQRLTDAIADAGGPQYESFTVNPPVETRDDNRDDPNTFGGVSLGNIRNAYLYNPDRVTLVEYVGLDREVLAARGVSVPTAFDTSRDPLEATFEFRGRRFVVINNHFSSRFGSTPIFGGPQPFVQAAESAREAQSKALNEVTQWLRDEDNGMHVIVLGDLNTFEWTNDLAEILPGKGDDRVLYNLTPALNDDNVYTFIFDGNSQALDHAFVTPELRHASQYDIVHVNVDYPRVDDTVGSDHEPIVLRINVSKIPQDKDHDDDDEDEG